MLACNKEKFLPINIARMIAEMLVPNTLLKEEIALLKTEEGRAYMFKRMYDIYSTNERVSNQDSVVKRHTKLRYRNNRS
jgi:hypothetical protein